MKLNLEQAQTHFVADDNSGTPPSLPPHLREGLSAELGLLESESRRLAKELHDEVLPLLARLSRAAQACNNADATLIDLISAMHSLLADFRDILGELQPVDLEELGLTAGLQNICNRYQRMSALCVIFLAKSDEPQLTNPQQLCIYRTVQTLLQSFKDSQNDILVLTMNSTQDLFKLTVRCVDKRVESANWITGNHELFEKLKKWTGNIGAQILFPEPDPVAIKNFHSNNADESQFPCDLEIELNLSQQVQVIEDTSIDSLPAILENARKENFAKILALLHYHFSHIRREILPQIHHKIASETANVFTKIESQIAQVIRGHYPQLLTELGIVECVRSLADSFTSDSKIASKVMAAESLIELDLSFERKFGVYRIVQEILNNVEKHAAASQVLIECKLTEKTLILQIEDNGVGFMRKRESHNRGLKNISERAQLIGASVHRGNSSTFSTGTKFEVELALDDPL